MSVRVMTAVWDMDLTATEKLVLLALADCANDEGVCWPSVATLAKKTGASERSVQRSLRAFEAAGILKREEVKGRGCRYFIRCQGVTPDTVSPVTPRRPTPDTVAPKPSKNHHNKHTTPVREHELPDDWEPVAFGAGTECAKIIDGWPPGEIDIQLEHFRALHAAKGDKFKNWQAAWKTWVLNSRRFNRNGSGQQNRGSAPAGGAIFRAGARRQAERAAGGLPRFE